MPRITNIRILQRTNLGNYEHFEFAADAVIAEDENLEQATQAVAEYVDWHARKTARDQKRRAYQQLIQQENVDEKARADAERWLAIYDERKARVEAM